MLCGQHALNNLLQSGLFTAPDLAEIARGLDALEASQLGAGQHLMGDSPWESSQNYDDSGFFSVQGGREKRFGKPGSRMRLTRAVMFAVMENALKVWGLRLVRWGSKEMQQVHDRPECVCCFVDLDQYRWH
jgi:ataxin-3